MKVELTRDDLICLVKGTCPNYDVMEHPLIKKCGSFSGSYGRWDWNYSFPEDLTEEQLWKMFTICKNSWS